MMLKWEEEEGLGGRYVDKVLELVEGRVRVRQRALLFNNFALNRFKLRARLSLHDKYHKYDLII